MAMEVFLCKVNYSWQKAGSAAGFASLEVMLVTRKQGVYQPKRRGEYWNTVPAGKKIPLQDEPGEQKSLTENDLTRLRILFWWGVRVCAWCTEWDILVISKFTVPALTLFTRSSSCGYNHTNTIILSLKNQTSTGFWQ